LRTLAIHPLKVHLILGQTKQLKLTGLLSDGQQAPASDLSDPVWRSDDPSAVTVNSSGKIKAVGDRRTRITVTIDGISVSIYVSVDVTGQSGQGPGGGTQAPRPVNSSTPTPTPTVVTSTPPPI
jgi:Bacterial Ig-like domain (group 2)